MNMQQERGMEMGENGISLIEILNGLKEFVQRGVKKEGGGRKEGWLCKVI